MRRGEVAATGKGGDRRSNDVLAVGSYAAKTARDLGANQRTVERDLSRGKKITPDVLADVQGTTLDKGVVLDELAHTPAPEQRAKLIEIQERRAAVRPAPDPLNDPEAHEKQLAALRAWCILEAACALRRALNTRPHPARSA